VTANGVIPRDIFEIIKVLLSVKQNVRRFNGKNNPDNNEKI